MLTALFLAAALQTAPAPPPEKKICRRDVATGTIMPRRTCRTRAEWAQIDAATSAMTDQTMRQRATQPSALREY
ncbi:hypothetical protein [Sphingomonas sp. Leaf25]|uniref:hypothetical protein n=1 Tax=Sphingomonas sp. Leaf25 TaxID=1735692 RepID=UPI0006F4C64C|nr:hypothetical protein [Sphingomonas sp. Leaf25]KQN03872.1 hypothetical protein ASE78_02045 [Sphingomonas sp. Leaf25]